MIFSRLENIELEKRTSLRVGSSDFISLNPLKTFFLSSSVSDVSIVKNTDQSRFPLVHLRYCSGNVRYRNVHLRSRFGNVRFPVGSFRYCFGNFRSRFGNARSYVGIFRFCFVYLRFRLGTFRFCFGDTRFYFGNGTSGAANDYTYDLNGNMILDKNKGITEIFYNYLDLPTYISLGSKGVIEYIYNAAGQKVKKRVYDNTVTPNTIKDVHYLDGFQYAGDVLQFFPHAEGYVNVTASETLGGLNYIYNYVYNYTDHLGNIRMSFTKDPVNNQLKILEENHYYPFGLKHAVYADGKQMYQLVDNLENTARPSYVYKTDYLYKYNGKEYQDELGLGMYAMYARMYDPAIARWVVIDPVIHPERSPYNAFDNNPIFWADPSGEESTLQEMWDATPEDGSSYWTNSGNGEFAQSEEKSDEDCCPGAKKLWGKVKKGAGEFVDKIAGRVEENIPTEGVSYWFGDDGFTYGILEDNSFLKITVGSWELVDELPPMGMIIDVPIGPSAGIKGAKIVQAGVKLGKKSTMVYIAKEGKKIVYIGITNNFAVRKAVHLRTKGIHIEALLDNLTRAEARGVEQVLIEAFGLGGKANQAGQLLNRINSISKSNPTYGISLEIGYKILKKNGIHL